MSVHVEDHGVKEKVEVEGKSVDTQTETGIETGAGDIPGYATTYDNTTSAVFIHDGAPFSTNGTTTPLTGRDVPRLAEIDTTMRVPGTGWVKHSASSTLVVVTCPHGQTIKVTLLRDPETGILGLDQLSKEKGAAIPIPVDPNTIIHHENSLTYTTTIYPRMHKECSNHLGAPTGAPAAGFFQEIDLEGQNACLLIPYDQKRLICSRSFRHGFRRGFTQYRQHIGRILSFILALTLLLGYLFPFESRHFASFFKVAVVNHYSKSNMNPIALGANGQVYFTNPIGVYAASVTTTAQQLLTLQTEFHAALTIHNDKHVRGLEIVDDTLADIGAESKNGMAGVVSKLEWLANVVENMEGEMQGWGQHVEEFEESVKGLLEGLGELPHVGV